MEGGACLSPEGPKCLLSPTPPSRARVLLPGMEVGALPPVTTLPVTLSQWGHLSFPHGPGESDGLFYKAFPALAGLAPWLEHQPAD